MGKCGGGVTFFGIILPIIPVWFNFNSCEESFEIDITDIKNISGLEIQNATLKYNNQTHTPYATEPLIETHGQNQEHKYEYGKKFKFKIPNFWHFRIADDKAIIVTGKTKDGQDFTQELPVKWGIMQYYNWSFP